MTNDERRWTTGAVVIAMLFVASVAGAVYSWPRGQHQSTDAGEARSASTATVSANETIEPPPVEPIDPEVIRRRAWDKIARHLAPADAASMAAIDRSLAPIEEFFAEHREGARPFAKSVLSLRGKWNYVKTRGVFGGDSEEHLAFLDEKFREHVFDPDELKAVVESSIADYVRTVHGIENKLLVTSRTEIEAIDPLVGSAIAGLDSPSAFAEQYQKMLEHLVKNVTRGVNTDMGLFVGSFVAAEVTQQLMVRLGRAVATRLGVSAGILGAGASGGAASAGVTIGLAIVIDMGIEWLMRLSGSDATTKVTAKVEESLDKLQAFILDGDPLAVEAYHKIRVRRETFESKKGRLETEQGRAKIEATLRAMEAKGDLGLRRMLLRLHYERARLREAALRKMILEGPAA